MPADKFCFLLHSSKHIEATQHNFTTVFSGQQVADITHNSPHCHKRGEEAESHRTVAPRKVNYLTLFRKQQKQSSEFLWPFSQFNAKCVNSIQWDTWLNTYLLISSSSLKVSFSLKAYLLPNNYCSSTVIWPFWIMKTLWNISILNTVSIHDGAILVYFDRLTQ